MTLSEAIADFERRKYALEKALQAALLHDTKGKIVELAQDIYSFLVPSVSEEGSDDPHILRKRARDLSENEPLVNAALKEVISQPLSGLGVYPQPDNNPAPSKTPDDDEWASVTNKQQAELPERKSHSNFQPRKQPVVHIRKPYDKGRIPNHDDMADVTYTPPAQGFVAQDGFCMPTPVVETAPQPEPEKKTDDPPRGAISYEPANKVATVSDYVAPEAQIERVADTLSKIPRGGGKRQIRRFERKSENGTANPDGQSAQHFEKSHGVERHGD